MEENSEGCFSFLFGAIILFALGGLLIRYVGPAMKETLQLEGSGTLLLYLIMFFIIARIGDSMLNN